MAGFLLKNYRENVMEFMSNVNWVQVVCVGCIPALAITWWVISSIIDGRIRDQRAARKIALRKRGVTTPAVIVSARRNMFTLRPPGTASNERKLIFEVDVQHAGHSPFRATFQDWIQEHNYTYANMQRMDFIGRKIWVTYDPNNPSDMVFEYFDEERESVLERNAWNERRAAFERLDKENRALFKTGVEAPAVIIEAEDLDLAHQFENTKVMRLKLEITSELGSPYQAETQAMIATASLGKYSVGKKVIIKYDPRDSTRVTLFRSAETA
jgi:hypothetical protein